ncbi:16S rRNA (guanine(527)-N(7))-methyltransferase RsmG [Gemmobacter fulvus]|uniref:Ribosomal RNA small subunit methyltransferase G n=2 Tax=Gemmobacter fulvus TaxID=2840474 RepID=A0A975S0B1_9RHOB|nr:16S rRNA (guanine(527)-N(7))-methyltransferase RsmG [Gemmobacter fulvus]MBT9246830.1 16S rRNA (guanine(527)-N(7))-methyltransferase RsmG [Gemmobacter fulvus]QWK89076.1 16S rRNA (guanine(527)-N(7))-methyltransferase RsmG [Gemmobacter fulvus]
MTHLQVAGLDVSRETSEKLDSYVALIQKWNKAINLISRSSEADIWQRHIADSAQLAQHLPSGPRLWLDLGSGAGLPGIVLAIIAAEVAPSLRFELVEVDQRKATFLRQVSRELGLNVTVLTERIEALTPRLADVVSARALASLSDLCNFAERHLDADGIAVFLKGTGAEAEIEVARRKWSFNLESFPSKTSVDALVLKLKKIRHV